MIKLATVFSGIGAIEHALERMGIEHKIVFACDNGDVDIFTKKIDVKLKSICKEFVEIRKIVSQIDMAEISEEQGLIDMIEGLDKQEMLYAQLIEKLEHMDESIVPIAEELFSSILTMSTIKQTRKKEYTFFLDEIKKLSGAEKKLCILKSIVEVLNDFRKDNLWESLNDENVEYESVDGIQWNLVANILRDVQLYLDLNSGKRLIKSVRDIAERLGMLDEKIKEANVKLNISKLETFEERKAYVDSLYKSYEKSNKVKQSYMANYELKDEDFHWNVSFLEGEHYKGEVDLFVGGSPCQSFSLVGKQRGLEDARGTLFYEYARLVKEIKPKIFIYENVRALLSNDGGNTWETIQKIFTDLDYTWTPCVLNAKDYGIPQNRERVFVIGFRNDLILKKPFEIPKPVELGDVTMKQFLLDNVSGKYYLPTKGVRFVTDKKNLDKRYTQIDGTIQLCQKKNQQFNWHGDFVFEAQDEDKEKLMKDLEKYFLSEKVYKYVMASGTKGFYSKPKTDLDIARPLLTTMHKMHRAGVDNYVTTEGRLRKLTPRECLRLMGFCDSFKIVVSDTAMYQQAGNSIVVDVLIAIMNSVLESYSDF